MDFYEISRIGRIESEKSWLTFGSGPEVTYSGYSISRSTTHNGEAAAFTFVFKYPAYTIQPVVKPFIKPVVQLL